MNLIKSIPMFVFLVGFAVQLYAKQDIGKSITYLERYIAKVERTVDNSGNADAVEMLNKAKESVQNASNFASAGNKKGAWKEIRKAHRHVSRSYHLARGFKQFKGKKALKEPAHTMAKKIERMEKHINAVTRMVDESGIEKAKTELTLGIGHFERAKGLNTEGKTEEAMEALQQAKKFINNAIRIVKHPKMIERTIKYLDKLLEKVQETVNSSENQEAIELLAQGVAQLENGKQLFNNGEMNQAKEALHSASKSINKAIRMVKGKKNKELKKKHFMMMEKWIERVTRQLEKAKVIVDESNSQKAKAKIVEAANHLKIATDLNGQDMNKKAATELKKASKLIHEAYMIVKLPEKVDKWIKHLEKRAEKVKKIVEESLDPKAKEFFDAGIALIADAQGLQSTGKTKEAIAELKKASKQINKAMRVAKLKMKRPNNVNP